MNFELYCKYARNNNIKCCLSELMVKCNKHYIIKVIHDEIPTGKCLIFDDNSDSSNIKITVINRTSLNKEAFVLVDIRHLYDPHLIECTTHPFAYLIHRS